MALTPDGRRRFAPDPNPAKGIALCLSGGGFRAALFHLGALRRLNEIGVLQQIDTITSVSGGSTIAAHLAYHYDVWKSGCTTAEWDQKISLPFRTFASRNFSTPSVLWGYPWWWTNVGVNSFARACERELYPDPNRPLPSQPNFQFCATELVEGKQHVFDRDTMQVAGQPIRTVGQAVAVSSAFPLIFWPYRASKPIHEMFVDGGVADNRGIEPVWRTHHTLLVSDGGDVLRPGWSQAFTYPWMRSLGILMAQMNEMQKRWLVMMFDRTMREGTYWSIASAVEHYRRDVSDQVRGYAPDVAKDCIAQIRLKYDAFSDAEAAILENHGYTLAAIAIKAHVSHLDPGCCEKEPSPLWLNDSAARAALRNSDSSSLGGHGWIRACLRAIRRNIKELMGGGPAARASGGSASASPGSGPQAAAGVGR